MASLQIQDRYEHLIPENAVLPLHQLCARCVKLATGSQLLRNMAEGIEIRAEEVETVDLCSAGQLKSGHLEGCHLCALLWTYCMGDISSKGSLSRPYVAQERIILKIQARDMNPPARTETGISRPIMGQFGTIVLFIAAVREHEDLLKRVGARSEIYMLPPSYPKLNDATLDWTSVAVSSKHDKGLAQVKDWFQSCVNGHTKCRDFSRLVAEKSELPSRFLNVSGGKIRLECNPSVLKKIQYTTLSHSWGKDPSLCPQLTQKLLESFKTEIPASALPAKYLDAIRITRYLGFRYVWIDSLCIIQDSEEDWMRESLKMASVYGRTSCNISYIYPPLDEGKKKFLRDPRLDLPCKISPDPGTTPSKYLFVQNAPGWIGSKRILCPRNIYYGGPRLLWECCEGVEDEIFGNPVNVSRTKQDFYSIFSGFETTLHGVDQFDTFNGQWYRLVQEYRLRDLTFEKDRAIAFSGVAKAIQNKTNLTYLAGIWKEFAELQLLWSVDHIKETQTLCQKDWTRKSDSSPSWSWFSIPRVPNLPPDYDVVSFQITIELYTQLRYAIYRAKVTGFDHPKLGFWFWRDPNVLFHDFQGLKITIKTRRVPATLHWDEGTLRVLPFGRYALGESTQDPKIAMVYLHDDITVTPGCSLPADAHMILILMEAWQTRGGRECAYRPCSAQNHSNQDEGQTVWQYAGLVVVPADKNKNGQDCWQRIGCFFFADRVKGQRGIAVPFLKDGVKDEEIVLV